MTDGDDDPPTDGPDDSTTDATASNIGRDDRDRQVEQLQSELSSLRERVDEKTLHRDDVEADLRRYVRRRLRRGHARGWGPYLVLLYGTAMTLGAFHMLDGGWAILAMVVVWLSTLGLFVFMLVVGFLLGSTMKAASAADWLRSRR
jgi:Flp pilus assembly protein TadB